MSSLHIAYLSKQSSYSQTVLLMTTDQLQPLLNTKLILTDVSRVNHCPKFPDKNINKQLHIF
jgi:hypothetical protein